MAGLPQHLKRVIAATAVVAVLLPAGAATADDGATSHVVVGAGAAGAVAAAGGDDVVGLRHADGVTADLTTAEAARLRAAGFAVAPDAEATATSVDAASAEAPPLQVAAVGVAWPGAGAGVGVALVDTGVADVPALAGRVVHGPNLSDEDGPGDGHGHGTFMAGLVAGGPTATSGAVGVAPEARIVSLKVAGRDGETTLARLVDALWWVAEEGPALGVRVVNLSFGVVSPAAPASDPLVHAVNAVRASGVLPVVAAGNEGSGTVTSPGSAPGALTVGATDPAGTAVHADDVVTAWSGRDDRQAPGKPELVAPGTSVVSLRAPGSAVDVAHPGGVVDAERFRGSGTSMATALTSGAAAALASRHPDWDAGELGEALVAGASTTADGAPAVDAAAADLLVPPAYEPTNPGGAGRPPATGPEWAGSRWSGSRWSGSRWSDDEWTGSRWSGSRWSDEQWTGSRWSGTSWSGTSWSGSRWSGTSWSGSRWSGTSWSGSRWSGTSWSGSRWSGSRWSEVEWDGSRWSGSRWSGSSWSTASWDAAR